MRELGALELNLNESDAFWGKCAWAKRRNWDVEWKQIEWYKKFLLTRLLNLEHTKANSRRSDTFSAT